MESLTDTETRLLEHRRQHTLAGLTQQEQAANTLLDAAAHTDSALATRALHVGMYAARIGRALLIKTPARDLWVLGVLSVLWPSETATPGTFARFADTLAGLRRAQSTRSISTQSDVHVDILQVAQTFENGVEQAAQTRGETSPADTIRMMMRDRNHFKPLVVAALRRALARPSQSLWASATVKAA